MCVCVCPPRELKFRKRAQSADDEGSVELAESLQHLTLSEFLKEYVGIAPFWADSLGPSPPLGR
jgi:hypothetical protein